MLFNSLRQRQHTEPNLLKSKSQLILSHWLYKVQWKFQGYTINLIFVGNQIRFVYLNIYLIPSRENWVLKVMSTQKNPLYLDFNNENNLKYKKLIDSRSYGVYLNAPVNLFFMLKSWAEQQLCWILFFSLYFKAHSVSNIQITSWSWRSVVRSLLHFMLTMNPPPVSTSCHHTLLFVILLMHYLWILFLKRFLNHTAWIQILDLKLTCISISLPTPHACCKD